jgi:hypothetical protein
VATLTAPAYATPEEPISPQQRQELAEANRRARKALKPAKVAAFNGWITATIAVMALPFALFSASSLIVEVGLAVVAYNEFRGRDLIRQFDSSGLRMLGFNQLGFLSLLIGYSLWSMYLAVAGPSPLEAYAELESSLGPLGDLVTTITLAVYGCVIFFSLIFQGLNAAYYFRCEKHLAAYLDQTPAWIVDLQRCSAVV